MTELTEDEQEGVDALLQRVIEVGARRTLQERHEANDNDTWYGQKLLPMHENFWSLTPQLPDPSEARPVHSTEALPPAKPDAPERP